MDIDADPRMELKIVKVQENYLEFNLGNVDNSFANALRRVMLAEVPMLAFDQVVIRRNTSVTHDEMLAHRIGLVPLLSWSEHARRLHEVWNCKCRMPPPGQPAEGYDKDHAGCSQCTVNMELRVSCIPPEKTRKVTADDIRPVDQRDGVPMPEGINIVPNARNIWLCTLGPGQAIDMTLRIRKGIAKEHAKWMPVATVSMQYVSDIRPNVEALAKLSLAKRKAFCKICPTGVFDFNEDTGIVNVANPERCIFCMDCMEEKIEGEELVLVRRKKGIEGKGVQNRFYYTFRVEGIGSIPCREILREGVNVLKQKIAGFKSELLANEAKDVSQKYKGVENPDRLAANNAQSIIPSDIMTDVFS